MPGEAPFKRRLKWRIEAIAFSAYSALMRLLPVDRASAFGGALLKMLGPHTGVERTVQKNLRLAFPELSPGERDALSRAQWETLGRMAAEFPIMDRITVENGRIQVEGLEHVEAARAEGRPIVFVTGHLSNWEAMAAAIVWTGTPTQITYRAANNPHIDRMIVAGRARYGVTLFAPKGGDGARDLMHGMKRGQSVALMNDQKFAEGPEVIFFGHPVNAASGPSRLAGRFGAAIVPISVERLEGARLKVTFHRPMPPQPDATASTQAITRFIEDRVRERPAEWFWTHKRWPDRVYAALESESGVSVERRSGPA